RHLISVFFFFFKQKTAYEITRCLEFRRVLFRSITRDAGYVNELEIEIAIQEKVRRAGGGLDQADERQRPEQRRDARLLEESGRGLGKHKHRDRDNRSHQQLPEIDEAHVLVGDGTLLDQS